MQIKLTNDGDIFPTYLKVYAKLDFAVNEWAVSHIGVYSDPDYLDILDSVPFYRLPRSSQLGVIAALRTVAHERAVENLKLIGAIS